jgi:hypothetical protein
MKFKSKNGACQEGKTFGRQLWLEGDVQAPANNWTPCASLSATRMVTNSTCCQCRPMIPNQSKESSVGAAEILPGSLPLLLDGSKRMS